MISNRSIDATSATEVLRGPGQLRIELGVRRAYVGEQEISLTKQSFELLSYLLAHQGRVVPNEELVRAIWAHEIVEDRHFLQTAMYRLRVSLRRADVADPIEVVRGVGYSIGRGRAATPSTEDRLRGNRGLEASIRAGFVPRMLLDRFGRIVFANHSAAERLGYKTGELEELASVAMLSPRAMREARMAMFGKVLAGEEIFFLGSRMLHRDGSIIPLDASVRPVIVDEEVVGAVFELWAPYGEVEVQEQAPVLASARLFAAAAAIRASRLPTIVLDANQRILLANEAMAKLTGYTADELEALPNTDSLSPPEARAERAEDLVAILSGRSDSSWSEPILRRDGSIINVELIAEPLSHEGTVAGVMIQLWPRPGEWALVEATDEALAS